MIIINMNIKNVNVFRQLILSFVYLTLFAPHLLKFYLKNQNNLTVDGFTMKDAPAQVILCTDENDMMKIANVKLIPDTPKKGQNLTVEISGYLKKTLGTNAYLVAKVKKAGMKFPNFHIAACDYLSSKCPVEKGPQQLSFTFDIPSLMPGGAYEIVTELYDAPGEIPWSKMGSLGKFYNNEKMKQEDPRVLCIQGSIEL
jgi:ML domain